MECNTQGRGRTKIMKKLMVLMALAAMTLIPATASARGGVFIRGGFGPGFYGGGPYWGGYWGPGYYGYAYSNTGEVKLDTKANDGQVFINGAFAGNTKDARSMHLRPGTYTIEVRHAGQEALNEQVFVIAGKTLHLHPAL